MLSNDEIMRLLKLNNEQIELLFKQNELNKKTILEILSTIKELCDSFQGVLSKINLTEEK